LTSSELFANGVSFAELKAGRSSAGGFLGPLCLL